MKRSLIKELPAGNYSNDLREEVKESGLKVPADIINRGVLKIKSIKKNWKY